MPDFSTLTADTETELCVIGAGITGITAAYLAVRAGRRVVVLEDGAIGSGETGRTTAHLTHALDDRYFELERLHGARGARLAAESHTAAIDLIGSIVRDEQIDCDFERIDGYLFVPPGESTEILEREQVAAQRAGLGDVACVDRSDLPFIGGPCLRFPRQAQFHPLKYLAALARAIERHGGRIHTGTHVSSIDGGAPVRVVTESGHTVSAEAVIVATNTPINNLLVMHTKQAAYRTYVVGLTVPAGSVPHALYWDTADPYHYVRVAGRLDDDTDLLIVGGEDHKTGQADDGDTRFEQLEQWARRLFPMAGAAAFSWSGQVMEPVDGLAFIGRNPLDDRHIYIATGDSGNGMTHGTIAAILLNDLIAARENAWASLYDPSRKPMRAIEEFGRENINVATQYSDWLTPGEVKSAEEIPLLEGAIVRRGLHKLAVYRDNTGTLHACQATCPHLGCVVAWNATEKSWDCPCHGSRFDPFGRVVNGPANTGLTPVGAAAGGATA